MKRATPTVRSLAREAGVSAMTVSLALRNRTEIPFSTRQRIQRLAKVRGYRVDPVVSKMMQYLASDARHREQPKVLGLKATASPEFRTHAFSLRVEEGIRARAAELGYAYETIGVPASGRKRLNGVVRDHGGDGLVILPMPAQTDLTALLDWEQVSVVSVTTSVVAPHFHRVSPHHFDNVVRAFHELAAAGFRRIGLAISQGWNERVQFRWSGAAAWHNTHGTAEPIPTFVASDPGPTVVDKRFVRWVERHQPDAILIESIEPTLLAAALGRMARRRRPALAALDWAPGHPGPGIDQQPEWIGAVAVDTLAGMIHRGERGIPTRPLNIAVDGRWVPATGS